MNRLRPIAFTLAILLVAGSATAQPRAGDCVIGPGLAATLLIPYFELDLAHPFNVTTLFSVNNGLSNATLTRVVLWTDWGVPTLAFDVYLRGFDVQTINVRDLFNGMVPSTGGGVDLSGFPFCGVLAPDHANPVLTPSQQAQLAADHTGMSGPLVANCAGAFHPDHIARGYITVDVVDECSGVEAPRAGFTPANTLYPYFANGGPAGIGINSNQLWGDVAYIDTDNAAAQASEAVALWADSSQFSGTNIYTFYGRLSGWDGRDDRVPLPYRWDQRFLNGGPFAGGADVVVWRDTEAPVQTVGCGGVPGWYPLTTGHYYTLDESGDNMFDLGDNRFPNASQRVSVNSLGIPYSFGWVQIDTGRTQSWVQPSLRAGGQFSAAWNGTPVEFNCGTRP